MSILINLSVIDKFCHSPQKLPQKMQVLAMTNESTCDGC